MTVIGIDPGPEQSAYVRWDGAHVLRHGIAPNADLRDLLGHPGAHTYMRADAVVFEKVESYGMAVGADIFATVFETGRLYEVVATADRAMLPRRAVKLHLCGSARAKDSNIRQALIDRFGGDGGRRAAVGLKASPGPLYGVRSHEWAALAVAVTWHDQHAGEAP